MSPIWVRVAITTRDPAHIKKLEEEGKRNNRASKYKESGRVPKTTQQHGSVACAYERRPSHDCDYVRAHDQAGFVNRVPVAKAIPRGQEMHGDS